MNVILNHWRTSSIYLPAGLDQLKPADWPSRRIRLNQITGKFPIRNSFDNRQKVPFSSGGMDTPLSQDLTSNSKFQVDLNLSSKSLNPKMKTQFNRIDLLTI